MDRARLLLKRKYRLAHIPRVSRVQQWHRSVRRGLEEGRSGEDAGLAAARSVFPYEYREPDPGSGPTVSEILAELDQDDSR